MTQLQLKIDEVKAEIEQVATEHNQLLEQKNVALQRFTELQGSLKTLLELQETEDGGEDS